MIQNGTLYARRSTEYTKNDTGIKNE